MLELKEIKRIRKKLGLTQVQLARQASVSQSLIAKIEAGRLDPTYTKTKKIFEILDSLTEKKSLKVEEVMNKKIISTRPDQSVKTVINQMKKYGISQVPVLEEGKVVGLVTEGLLLEKAARNPHKLTSMEIKQIMEDVPPIVSPKTDMAIASALLRHFPIIIVMERGKIKGLITKYDIIEKLSR